MLVVSYANHQIETGGLIPNVLSTMFTALVLLGLRNVAVTYVEPFDLDETDLSVPDILDDALTCGKVLEALKVIYPT